MLQSPSPLEVGNHQLCAPLADFSQCRGAGSCQHVPAAVGRVPGRGTSHGQGGGAAGGSPGAILTAVPVSAPQKALKEMFPIESGDINMENRIIPHLPGEGQVQGWGLKEKLKLVGKFPGGASSAGRLLRSCLVQFLFLPTGLEIKTPERSERRRQFLPTLASPADPVLPPRRRAMSHSIAATPGWHTGSGFGDPELSPSSVTPSLGLVLMPLWQHRYFVRGSDAICLQ